MEIASLGTLAATEVPVTGNLGQEVTMRLITSGGDGAADPEIGNTSVILVYNL